MPKLIPAILEKTEEEVRKKIEILKALGLDTAHLDVMDGLAVPNRCWGIPEIAATFDINLEVHLMMKKPLDEALKWLELKKVFRVIVCGEEVFDWNKFSNLAKSYPNKLGFAFDPTSLFWKDVISKYRFDFILVMGVISGASGQKFDKKALENIILTKYRQPNVDIGVDGGMNELTIPAVKQFGVKVINTASYFWNSSEKEKVINFVESE